MAILGTVLKGTAKLGNQLAERKRFDYSLQRRVLLKLLEKAKGTQFGLAHDFAQIGLANNPEFEFSHKVPIRDYSAFYGEWLHKVLAGEKDVVWPGKIKYFALSSGTSGAPSKRIPVSDSMIKNFQRVGLLQMLTLHDYGLDTDFYEKSMLIIGGSTKLAKKEHYKEGDLSGILSGKIPFWFTKFSKPGKKVRKLTLWNEKLEAIVQEAPNWDIGIISGVPAWVELVMKAIIARYELKTIHEIWPSLRVYVHGGVAIEPYRNELVSCFDKKVFFQETYLASEGYFAYQKGEKRNGMQLLLNAGVYFEFIPFSEVNFSADGQVSPQAQAIPLHEVKENVDYALLVSTCSGLWRYLLGDTIRFTSLLDYEIKITGRITHFLSVCGEHVSVANMDEAMRMTGVQMDLHISEYTAYATVGETLRHVWYVAVDRDVAADELAEVLDSMFMEINDDYAAVRLRSLEKPQVRIVARKKFNGFLASQGKEGGQNKFPRVMKQEQLMAWKHFLGEN